MKIEMWVLQYFHQQLLKIREGAKGLTLFFTTLSHVIQALFWIILKITHWHNRHTQKAHGAALVT